MALLEARGMVRTYGSVVALDGADFDIEAGQVTALIGDNGAGKSTMVKILSGTEQFEEGEVILEGQKVVFNNPAAADNPNSMPLTVAQKEPRVHIDSF